MLRYKLSETANITEIINAATTAAKETFSNAAKVCPSCGEPMKKNGKTYECSACGTTVPVDKKNSDVMSQEEIDALKADVARFEKLNSERIAADAELLVNGAIADGKILPALKEQFINDAKKDFTSVKTDLEGRAKNSAVPLKMETPKTGTLDLNDANAIANSARGYMKEQEALGNSVCYTDAVNHVYEGAGGKR